MHERTTMKIFTDNLFLISGDQLFKVAQLIRNGLVTDGEKHKQQYLQEIAQELKIYLDDLDFEKGIPD